MATEQKKKAGFSRIMVKDEQEVRERKISHQDDMLYMKLYLGNKKCLWLPVGISPELLKLYLSAAAEL